MVHQYLKTCVLSVCVAALCGGRAFGGKLKFSCQACYNWIEDENWGKHIHEAKEERHKREFDKPTIRCTLCDISIGDLNAIKSHRKECPKEACLKYSFRCPTCHDAIHADDWFVHLWYDHWIPNSVMLYRQNREDSDSNDTFSCWTFWQKFKTAGSLNCDEGFMESGTFLCGLCGQPGTKSKGRCVPVLLWYDHLKEKHRENLPKRDFYCKTCNNFISGSVWNKHVKEEHADWLEEDGWELYCEECKMMVPKENWNEHVHEKYKKKFLKPKDDFILWCEIQKKMIWGKDWNSHVEDEMKKLSWYECCKLQCRICHEMVSRDDFNNHTAVNHRRSLMPDPCFGEPDLLCGKCDKVVPMIDWNEHTVSEHKEYLPGGHVWFWCRLCGQKVPPRVWNAHAEGKGVSETEKRWHKGPFEEGLWNLFCPECNVMVLGKKWNEHMEAFVHKRFDSGKMFYCSEGCREYFLDQQSKEDHVKNKHQDWFFCNLCNNMFRDKKEHFREEHPEKGYVCDCGAYFRNDCDDGKTKDEHLSKHFVKCDLCNEGAVTIGHMKSKHGCDLKDCRPEAITKEKVWKWRHGFSCKNILPCPLCRFKSILPDVEKHMRENHKCTQECRFNAQKVFEHGASCIKNGTRCHLCNQALVGANLKKHGIQEHGCVEECPMLTGKGRWHHCKCRDWILAECQQCGERGVNCSHIFEKHLREIGCGKSCFIIQDQGEGGMVFVQHKDHRNNDKVMFAAQEGE